MESGDWSSIQDPDDSEIANQLTGGSDTKPLLAVGEKRRQDALSKYGVKQEDAESFLQRHEALSELIKIGLQGDAPEAGNDDDFQDDPKANGCRPWVGAIKAPTWYKRDANLSKKPNVDIQLDFIHGYRSKDCRNNVKLLHDGTLIYNAAGVAVIFDPKSNSQRFFKLHTDDVTAIAVSKDQKFIATGQNSDTKKKCPIYIWRTDTMEVVQKVRDAATKGCQLLSFSPDGSKLVSVSMNDSHDLSVIDVSSGKVLKSVSGGTDKLFQCKWRDDNIIVTSGEKHLRLWNLAEGLSFKRGIWGANKCSTRVIGMTVNPINKDILLGAADGTLQVFKMNTCAKVIQLHANKIIDALIFSEGYILTGGRDSQIFILDAKDYRVISKIDAGKVLTNSLCAKVRSLQLTPDHSTLFVATFGSEIYKIKLTKKPDGSFTATQFKQILAGHYSPNGTWTNEVWGLDLFKNDPDLYATVSDDSTLRVWSVSQRKQINATSLNLDEKGQQLPLDVKNGNDFFDSSKARCLAVAPSGEFLVGFKDGTLRLVDKDLKLKAVKKHAKEWISAIKFSPEGNSVAVGSHDNAIYVYSFPQLKLVQKLNKHTSFITQLDFSQNGQYIRSVCGAYDLLFWDVKTGQHLTGGATALRDEEWASHSCIFSWPVQKMWKTSYNDYTDINFVDRSNSKINGDYVLVNGDDFSTVNLFKWPCVNSNAQCIEATGHCSHVTNVRFTLNDKYIISTGGEDNSVFVWKLNY